MEHGNNQRVCHASNFTLRPFLGAFFQTEHRSEIDFGRRQTTHVTHRFLECSRNHIKKQFILLTFWIALKTLSWNDHLLLQMSCFSPLVSEKRQFTLPDAEVGEITFLVIQPFDTPPHSSSTLSSPVM